MGNLLGIDLFAGCGGVTEGLKQAGVEVIAAVEINPSACETYLLNHYPTELVHDDIRQVSPRDLRKATGLRSGDLFVLAACAPCQGFSRIRTRNGARRARDPKNSLVLSVIPFVEEFAPQAVLLENVPAMAASHQHGAVRRQLKRLGYRVLDEIVDAADFGVPQRRKRHVVVARKDQDPVLPETSSHKVTVREAIGHLDTGSQTGDPLHMTSSKFRDQTRERISAIPKDGGSRYVLPDHLRLRCHMNSDGFGDVYGRMHWDRPAPTITGGFVNPSKGRFLHPEEDRTVTIREAMLLQSFPADYFVDLSRGKYAAAELVGNAVPPEFVRRQAAALLRP
jgi:DNA (cytosine-5)-methyltransferase 1